MPVEPQTRGERWRGPGAVRVTGGAGYVGSHIVLGLRDAGYPVVAVDDLSTGDRGAVPVGGALIRADAADGEAICGAIARYGVAAAVHAAADLHDTPEAATRNREVCASFVRACAASGVRRLVLTSSAAVYGAGPKHPIAESRPPAPQRPCGAGKALVEAACEAALGRRGPVTVFGTDYPSQTLFYCPSTWLQHMLLLGFAIHLETARGEPGRGTGAPARWSTALAALRERTARAVVPARAALAVGAGTLAGGSLTANDAMHTAAAAIYRADYCGSFLEDMEQSIDAFEPMANGPRIILFNNVAASWVVLWNNRRAEALELVRRAEAEAPLALAAEPQSWVIHHALTRLYRQFAATDPSYADLAQSHFERSLELAPNVNPLELPPASPP